MSGNIETDAQFLASLDRAQKRHFLLREAARQAALQAALADLARGLSAIGSLHGEALSVALAAGGGD